MNISQIINGVNPVITPNEKNINKSDPIVNEQKNISKEINYQKPTESKELEKSIKQANKIFNALDKKIQFIVDDNGKSNFRLKIVDSNTKETIREFPDSYVVSVIEKINEMVGVLVDKKI